MSGKYGDQSEGKDSIGFIGNGVLVNLSQSVFDCPICTCENDVGSKIEKAKYPVFKTACKGCKRKIEVFSCPFTGKLTVKEILNKKTQKE